jgi:hypothetical protein
MRLSSPIKVLAASIVIALCTVSILTTQTMAGETSITPPFPTDGGESSSYWDDPLLGAELGALALIY